MVVFPTPARAATSSIDIASRPRSASSSRVAAKMARSASALRGRPRGAPPGISPLMARFYHRDSKRSVTYLIGVMPALGRPVSAPAIAPPPPAAPPVPASPPRRQPLQLALILVAAFMVVLD